MRTDPYGNELLRRMHYKHGAYWYVHKNKWTRLGHTYNRALKEWADMQETPGEMPNLIKQTYTAYELKAKQGELTESTLKSYNAVKSRLLTAFANMNPDEVTPGDVKRYLAHYHGHQPNVGNRALVVLREAFSNGQDMDLCQFNPAAQIKRTREKKRMRRLTDAEFKAIRQCAKGQLPLIMDVLYYTAQRISDVLAIKQSDISGGVIRFVQQKTGNPLDIEVGEELDKAISAARSGPVTGLWLFSKHGKPLSYYTVRSAYKAACERAKVEGTTLHDIRAKAITDLSLAGYDPQAIAGHKDPKVTERYIREKVVPVVKSLDSLGL